MKQSSLRPHFSGYILFLVVIFLFADVRAAVQAQETTVEYSVVRVFAQLSFDQPLLLLQAPDDPNRWYVVEQAGVVRTFTSGAAEATIFADITDRVSGTGGERGLLGMAFHPNYPDTPQIFLSYTASSDHRTIISRFTVASGGLTLHQNSEQIVLQQPQPFSNHNGGNILFGPDGYLYIGMGDGGSAGDPQDQAQNTRTLHGAVLRIDVDGAEPDVPYAIPPDNPFFGQDCSTNCPEIYAWGFRNPWRFSFDRLTGQLWLGDVGQSSWEEVNRVERGGNYGWRCYEGNHLFNLTGCDASGSYRFPVVEYSHVDGDCSITGGYVYRGAEIDDLRGRYIFGDFCTGSVWAVVGDGSGGRFEKLLQTGLRITSFAEDAAGRIYLLDRASGGIFLLRGRIVSPAAAGLPWSILLLSR